MKMKGKRKERRYLLEDPNPAVSYYPRNIAETYLGRLSSVQRFPDDFVRKGTGLVAVGVMCG